MRKMLTLALVITIALTLAACGNKNNNNGSSADDASTNVAKQEVKKIIVGTGSQFPKVAFLDDSGKLTGYDVELVRLIDERLVEYEFDIQVLDFTNILLSLETKKIDFAAHEFERNEERSAKYLFNKEAYAHWKNKIIVSKDNNDSIESLDDLKGKKVFTTATSAQAQILENYNKANNNAIEIVYSSGAANDIVTQITTGRVDASVGADFILPIIDPEGKLKTTGEQLSEADILFLFRKDDADQQVLADAVDRAIIELKADGALGKLSTEWLGFDATVSGEG